MFDTDHTTSCVTATVEQVLPQLGLAYLAGDDTREWTVTKSTPGLGLNALAPGQRVALTVERNPQFDLVRGYTRLP